MMRIAISPCITFTAKLATNYEVQTAVWISRLDKEIARYHVGLVWLGAMPYHVSALASSQEGHVGGKGE